MQIIIIIIIIIIISPYQILVICKLFIPKNEKIWRIKFWSERTVTSRCGIYLNLSLYPDTLHDVLKQLDLLDLLYVTIQRSVILNTCNIGSS